MKVKLIKDLDGRKAGEVVDAANGVDIIAAGYGEPVIGTPEESLKDTETLKGLVSDAIKSEIAKIEKERPANKSVIDADDIANHEYKGLFPNRKMAWAFGNLAMACNPKWATRCTQKVTDAGFAVTKALSEGVGSSGANLVPDVFVPTLINLTEQYGVLRRNAQVVPMSTDNESWPVLAGDVTVYYPGEGGTITASDITVGSAGLSAKKAAALEVISSELGEDAAITVGEIIAESMGRKFAQAQDQAGFIGDGTSTYGGTRGVAARLTGLNSTIAYIAGLVVASGNLFSEFAIGDFESVVGKLPQYAEANAKWFTHKLTYFTTAYRVAMAAGGANATEMITGVIGRNPTFFGSSVEFTQVMPKADANSQVAMIYGDMRLATLFGDRRVFTLEQSRDAYFTTDQIGIRATERRAINVHSVGNANATATSRVEGPVIGLISAAA